MRTISGGYFFVRAGASPENTEPGLLPERLWTPTRCFCDLYPEYWAISWCAPSQEETDLAIDQLGLAPSDLQPLQQWVERQLEQGGVGFPGTLLRHDVALEFGARFVRDPRDIKLLGIGLPEDCTDEFLAEAAPRPGEGPAGIYQAMEAGADLHAGGERLGFEPLGYDHGGFHSFICNSLERDCALALGLTINPNGKFTERADCDRAVEFIRLDSTGAEPALWQPWLIVEYPWQASR
jgi:hypothetical protein